VRPASDSLSVSECGPLCESVSGSDCDPDCGPLCGSLSDSDCGLLARRVGQYSAFVFSAPRRRLSSRSSARLRSTSSSGMYIDPSPALSNHPAIDGHICSKCSADSPSSRAMAVGWLGRRPLRSHAASRRVVSAPRSSSVRPIVIATHRDTSKDRNGNFSLGFTADPDLRPSLRRQSAQRSGPLFRKSGCDELLTE